MMKRFLAFLLLLTLCSCTSTSSWRKTLPSEALLKDLKTKIQVMQTFGGPASITYRGDSEVLVYVRSESQGGGLGIGTALPVFFFSSEHKCFDTLIFKVNKYGEVENYKLLVATNSINDTLWPFE